jgi:hypothetical protein
MSQDSRNYYDDQFNDRINQIAKPGATPPRSAGSGSSGGGGWGLKGGLGGGAILVFLLIRLALVAGRVGSSSTPAYSPPTYQPQPITIPEHQFDPKPIQNEKLREEFRKMREKQRQDAREPAGDKELPPWKAGQPPNPPFGGPKDKAPPVSEKK